MPIIKDLVDPQHERLQELEEIIDRHLVGFIEVGRALTEVRDDKLYQATYRTFEAWAEMRFAISRRRAYELMSACKVRGNLERHGAQRLPANERQSRELSRLEPDEQPVVWDQALELAGDDELTEKHVRQALRERNRQERVANLANISAGNEPVDGLRPSPIILADCPWQYDASTIDPSRQIENHYPTMPLADIKALDVPVTPDAVLFLWAVAPLLPEALEVMAAWGFTYKTNLAWDKQRIGPGYWFRNQHEHLLLGVRGNPPKPAPGVRQSSVLQFPRGKHSAKPDLVHEMIEAYYPELPKLELFARAARPGWSTWGNQAGGES